MMYIANAFSLQMLPSGKDVTLTVKDSSVEEVVKAIIFHGGIDADGVVAAIGHADTAAVVAKMINEYLHHDGRGCEDWDELCMRTVKAEDLFHRISIRLDGDAPAFVCQVVGGRLPEGCTELPEGIQLIWKKVVMA